MLFLTAVIFAVVLVAFWTRSDYQMWGREALKPAPLATELLVIALPWCLGVVLITAKIGYFIALGWRICQ